MKVVTDPDTSATLYNGEIKVILPAVDVAAINRLLQLPPSLARYICARADDSDNFHVSRFSRRDRSARVSVLHPPTFCLAMLATSRGGNNELEILRELWSGGGEGFLPRPVLIDPAIGPDAALNAHRVLFDAAVTISSSSAARLLLLQNQYAAFRVTHEQLQNAFDTVEEFLSRANLPSTWLAFACEPTDATLGPPDRNGLFELSQRLPLPTQGLAAIELHATQTGAGADGVLNITLAAAEDQRSLGDWAIPYDVIPQGWMFLDLPEIDIAPGQTAMLSAVWNTGCGRAPALSLTSWQPEPESRVRVGGQEASERSLALRLHVGLPGSRRIRHPFHIGVMRRTPVARQLVRLAPSVLRRFAEIGAAAENKPLVHFVEEMEAIELSPVNGTSTVAKLPGALPPRTRRLSAMIRTEDPAGALVEYALLAIGPGDSHQSFLSKGLAGELSGGFSGWMPIDANFTTQIHLDLTEPATRPLDLYLATRLAPGQMADSARTRWLEFVVDSFPEAKPA